jgi:hypothetical protein
MNPYSLLSGPSISSTLGTAMGHLGGQSSNATANSNQAADSEKHPLSSKKKSHSKRQMMHDSQEKSKLSQSANNSHHPNKS